MCDCCDVERGVDSEPGPHCRQPPDLAGWGGLASAGWEAGGGGQCPHCLGGNVRPPPGEHQASTQTSHGSSHELQ